MTRIVPLQCLIVGVVLLLIAGCSMSRGNLARNRADTEIIAGDERGGGKTDQVQTASADSTDQDADGPPNQPGVKRSGKSRKKLTGWMGKSDPKRESIPLDRTDAESAKNSDESLAEDTSSFWNHSETTGSESDPQVAKSKSPKTQEVNPFEP